MNDLVLEPWGDYQIRECSVFQKCCFLQCDHFDQGHSLDISKTPSLSTHAHTHELTSRHHGNGKQRIELDVHITQSGQAFPLGLQGKLGEQPWSTTWYAWHISSHLRSYLLFFSQILSSLSLPITRKFHACCGYEKHHNLTRTKNPIGGTTCTCSANTEGGYTRVTHEPNARFLTGCAPYMVIEQSHGACLSDKTLLHYEFSWHREKWLEFVCHSLSLSPSRKICSKIELQTNEMRIRTNE